MLNLIKEIKQPILLTGATGFLGSNLLHFFVKNNVLYSFSYVFNDIEKFVVIRAAKVT